MTTTALVLSGGGARGAYQAGAINALTLIASELGIAKPFQIITGVSAGAINAAYLAAHAQDLGPAAERLTTFWSALRSEQVFRTDAWSLGRIGFHWAVDAVSGGPRVGQRSRALLDTSPLRNLLHRNIPFSAIRTNLATKHLDAFAVSATNYATSECISFFMHSATAASPSPWRRSRRVGLPWEIGVPEVMASSAIPLLFPPVTVGARHFGDGCLRNSAPLSPAVHLGADRLIAIGVRRATPIDAFQPPAARDKISHADLLDADGDQPHGAKPSLAPSIARVLNVLINAVLLDGVDADIERLMRINKTVSLLPEEARKQSPLRVIDCLYLHPSTDIARIAIEESSNMPRLIRYLVSGLGSMSEAADVISYLLFEPSFCRRLIRLGYEDTMARKEEISKILTGDPRATTGR